VSGFVNLGKPGLGLLNSTVRTSVQFGYPMAITYLMKCIYCTCIRDVDHIRVHLAAEIDHRVIEDGVKLAKWLS